MALSITVNGAGTFTASMEEGPVSFTASLGAVPGPKGDTGPAGANGSPGVVAATAPLTYDSGTQTVGISATPSFTSVTATTVNLTTATFADATSQTTAFVGEARKVYVTARNSTGSTIAKGKVVYLSGGTGNVPNIALALADSEATSARTIGITAEAIANNANGKVIISGAVENIDTSAFSDGDTVYLSATTAGGLTTTLPAAPLHGVVIGIVTRANPSVGSIEVSINNYQELKELSDVNVGDRANNDGLFWESSSSTWRSKTVAEVLGYTPANGADYLAKADNLSGLASASTARTNLGLGTAATASTTDFAAAVHTHTASQISDSTTAGRSLLTAADAAAQRTSLGLGTMATETAANYAVLASPSFTGDPKAPTPATSDNDTSIATTAFVNAYCPAASTSTAGKVQLATSSDAIAGTSTTLAVTPAAAKATRFILLNNEVDLTPFTWLSTFSTWTGTRNRLNFPINSGGSTSAGSGLWRIENEFTSISTSTSIDFSKRASIAGRFRLSQNGATTNNIFRFTIGKSGTAVGDLSNRGFGVRCLYGNAMELQVHDGTTLRNVTSSFTPTIATSGTAFDVRVESDGAGNVTLFVNGSSVATSANGPTDQGAGNGRNLAQFELESASSNTNAPLATMAVCKVNYGTI